MTSPQSCAHTSRFNQTRPVRRFTSTSAISALRPFRAHASPYRRRLLAGAVLATVEIGFGLAQPWPLKVVVDDVLAPSQHAPVGNPDVVIAGAVIALVVIVGFAALADYWSTWLMASAGQHIGNDLRTTVFARLQRLSLRFHDENRVGDLSTRVTSDVDRVQDMLVQVLAVLVPNALLVTGMIVVMFVVDPTFALLSLACTPILAVAVVRSTRSLHQASRDARKQGGALAVGEGAQGRATSFAGKGKTAR